MVMKLPQGLGTHTIHTIFLAWSPTASEVGPKQLAWARLSSASVTANVRGGGGPQASLREGKGQPSLGKQLLGSGAGRQPSFHI